MGRMGLGRWDFGALEIGIKDDLLKEIGVYTLRFEGARQCLGYFKNNRDRMRSRVPRHGTLCLKRRCRGGVQDGDRGTPKKVRHALERSGSQDHPRSPMVRSEQALRVLWERRTPRMVA